MRPTGDAQDDGAGCRSWSGLKVRAATKTLARLAGTSVGRHHDCRIPVHGREQAGSRLSKSGEEPTMSTVLTISFSDTRDCQS